jgi:hypothetical protein
MAELSCAGTLMGETMSAASTRSSASRSGTRSAAVTGVAHWRTMAWAAATGNASGS